MSILTKLFVVLVSVLSVLLVALVVPFVANTENFRAQRDEAQAAAQRAQTTARERQSEIAALQAGEAQRTEALRSTITELNSQISQLRSSLSEAQVQLEAQKASATKFAADLANLTAAERQHAQILAAQEQELKDRRATDVDQKTRLIQLADRINELTGQNESLQRAVRRFQEEKVALTEELEQLKSKIAQLPEEARAALREETVGKPFMPEHAIQGRVTQVQEYAGQTFLQINIGARDGVAENMKFLIHRGDKYLGDLVITLVDEQAAAGVVRLAQGAVASGDEVRTGGRF